MPGPRVARAITSLKQLNPGDRITIHSRQFNAANSAVFISHDRTGLNREIGYAAFDRQGFLEAEFAIWQFELDSGETTITK